MGDTGMGDAGAGGNGVVLVTGGSGYIAGFCIAQLLREGWSVRATVRSLAREAEVRAALGTLVEAGADRLAFVAADLNGDRGWAEAAAGCRRVLHVASPIPTANPRDDDELVRRVGQPEHRQQLARPVRDQGRVQPAQPAGEVEQLPARQPLEQPQPLGQDAGHVFQQAAAGDMRQRVNGNFL